MYVNVGPSFRTVWVQLAQRSKIKHFYRCCKRVSVSQPLVEDDDGSLDVTKQKALLYIICAAILVVVVVVVVVVLVLPTKWSPVESLHYI